MHTPTLSQKDNLRWPFWRSLVTLLFLSIGLGFSQKTMAQVVTLSNDVITLTTQPTGVAAQPNQNFTGSDNDGLYDNPTPLGHSDDNSISVPQLGTYDLNGTSSITITGAQIQGLIASSGTTVTATRLQYRVYLDGTLPADMPAYSNISLTTAQTGTSTGSSYTSNGSTAVELLSGLTSGGTYVLDIRFQADAKRVVTTTKNGITTTNTTTAGFSDLSGDGYFYANFDVTAPPITPTGGTTVWQSTVASGGSTNWLLASNWSNGVPTATSNAIIPAKTNSAIVYPVLGDPNAPYAVKNLTLQGATGSSAAQLTIGTATLRVFGNISQISGGLTGPVTNNPGVTDPTQNSTIILAGADQIITGQLQVSDVIVAGSGIKSVLNTVIPSNIIAFRPTDPIAGVIIQSALQESGSIQTVFSTSGTSFITLVSTSTISSVQGERETNTSYIKGVTRADRILIRGIENTFGNIGLDITANHTPGNIFVFRVVGDPLTGPLAAGAVPTKRYYQIRGDDDSTKPDFSSSNLSVVFHYLDSVDELNGIEEKNLNLFTAQQNGAPFRRAYGTLVADKNIVTRAGIASSNNFYLTLGDVTNPLPVVLTAFTATRTNVNALLTWQTASEQNNKGFEVQVSTNGVTYRTLTFVESNASNSVLTSDYQYLDTEAKKTGVRYYRLRQIDIDGTDSYSPIRTVSFTGGEVVASFLVASPNPFSDKLAFSFNGTTPGDGTAQVTLVDMAGRTVHQQRIALNSATMSLNDLSGLRAGLYVAKITLPDGSSKMVRVQKQ